MSPLRIGACALFVLLGSGSVAHGQERPAVNTAAPLTLPSPPGGRGKGEGGLPKVRKFRETALSPDGKRVAWVETFQAKDGTSSAPSAIFIADLDDKAGKARRLTEDDEPCMEHSPSWSPDGKQLAFLSNRGTKEQLQLYVAPAAGGKVKRLTNLKGFLADPRWSPDGQQLAFLFTENALRDAGPVQPAVVETGEVGQTVQYQRLSTLDLQTGKVRQVSPADLYVYEYDWSPDSKQSVLSAAHGSGDDNWYLAQLHVLSLASGKTRAILKPDMQIAMTRWSPDGKTIAFIGGLMSDQGANGGDIFTLPVPSEGKKGTGEGGKVVNRTPDLGSSVTWLTWEPSSKQIVFTEHIDGSRGIARLDLEGGVKHLWKGDERITAKNEWLFSVSAPRDCRTFALVRHSFEQPPEVWAGALGKWQAVTRANQGVRPAWGKARSLHWKSDSFRIQGWLLYPEKFDPRQRYPLVVNVHGGAGSAGPPPLPAG